ncbi:MAG: AmmeMemoRadiSam system protein B [Candidatus Brocadiae bacterium]|nr:AmmeMemoRadiSam system protein B [Candidatus Brocadiia bacterium]
MNRRAYQAGFFYPAKKEECHKLLKECIPSSCSQVFETPVLAGIVPHAGWTFSGPTAGKVYHSISVDGKPDTFVLFGAVHIWGVDKAALWKEGKWESPLGSVEIDYEFCEQLLKSGSSWIEANSNAHIQEHSLEVQIPFIQYLFPNAKIVPVMIPPSVDAVKVGKCVASLLEKSNKNIVVLGSTDMTHYGSRFHFTPAGMGEKALEWVKTQNDHRMIQLISGLEEDKIVEEATKNHNACGAGAIAATVAFAKARQRKSGKLLEYTTSWDVYPERKVDTFVGYAGFIF